MKLVQSFGCLAVLGLVGCADATFPTPAEPNLELISQFRAAGAGDGAGETEVVVTGTGWGTLKGSFTLDGAAPSLTPLSTGKDVAVCGQTAPNESLVVDPSSKGIANIVVYANKVSRVYQPETEEARPPQVFDQKACIFLSHVFAVKVSDQLLIKNSDPVGHNTNFNPQGNPGINPSLPANGEFTYNFVKQLAQPSPVVCSIHPWMKAYILARDDGYFAVTDEQGNFEIANLPAGEELEIAVWHELAGGKGGFLPAKSEWTKGRFKVTLEENGVHEENVSVPLALFQ